MLQRGRILSLQRMMDNRPRRKSEVLLPVQPAGHELLEKLPRGFERIVLSRRVYRWISGE